MVILLGLIFLEHRCLISLRVQIGIAWTKTSALKTASVPVKLADTIIKATVKQGSHLQGIEVVN